MIFGWQWPWFTAALKRVRVRVCFQVSGFGYVLSTNQYMYIFYHSWYYNTYLQLHIYPSKRWGNQSTSFPQRPIRARPCRDREPRESVWEQGRDRVIDEIWKDRFWFYFNKMTYRFVIVRSELVLPGEYRGRGCTGIDGGSGAFPCRRRSHRRHPTRCGLSKNKLNNLSHVLKF